MPRLRGSSISSPARGSSSLRIEVEVNGVRVLVPCEDGSQPVSWLAHQATSRYAATSKAKPELEGKTAVVVQELLTSSGALLSMDDPIEAVVGSEPLFAEIAFPELSSGCPSGLDTSIEAAISHAALSFGECVEAYGHNARVFDLAFSPADSDRFATASEDGSAKVWQYSAQHLQYWQAASFHGHLDAIMRVNWDPTGTMIATGSADTSVKLWRPNADPPEPSHAAATSSSGQAGYGVEAVAELSGHPEEVYAAEWLEGTSGQTMLTASTWTPVLWDLQTCQRTAEGEGIPVPDPAAIGEPLALLPGEYEKEAVTALVSPAGMPERWQAGHIFSARQSPRGGCLVAAACSDGGMRFWRLNGGRRQLEAHAVAQVHLRAMGTSCAWDPEGFQVASLAIDGSLAVLDVRMGGRVCWAVDVGRPLYSCCYVPSCGHTIAVCGGGPDVTLLSTGGCAPSEASVSLLDCSGTPVNIDTADVRWGRTASESARTFGGNSMGSPSVMEPELAGQRSPRCSSLDKQRLWNAAEAMPSARLPSASSAMGQRNLLCIAASCDGTSLAASGEAALLGSPAANSRRGLEWGNALTDGATLVQPSHKQGKRSAVEIWRRPSL